MAPSADRHDPAGVVAATDDLDNSRPGARGAPQGQPDEGLPPLLGDRYRLDERLSKGSSATLYRATDLATGRALAIKLFGARVAADPAFRTRFLRKASAVEALQHPHVARVYDAGVADGRPYLVTQLILGQSLRALLELRGRLPVHSAVRIAAQLADALAYAHTQGLFHTDLRPENVLLDSQGWPRIVDFGVADVTAATGVVAIETVARRAAYLAPEQVRGDAVGPRTDVYALAVMLYEMLVGSPPLAGTNVLATASRRLFSEPPRLRGERPDISWGLEYVVRKGLAPDPMDRYPSAQAFRAALLSPPNEGQRVEDEEGPPVPVARRAGGGWLGPRMVLLLPLAATLLLVSALSGLFDFIPPVFVPFQSAPVPDFTNRSYAEAELVARGGGVEVAKTRPEPCDDQPREFVIRQDPSPGGLIRRGNKVRLTVCSGMRVPNLVGQSEEAARVQLVRKGWTVAGVRTVNRGDVAPGTIVAQEPTTDVILPDKEPLVLTVAQPPTP